MKAWLKNWKETPAIVFLWIVLAFGLVNIFLVPLVAGYDEEMHLGRLWELANGQPIPNRWMGVGENYPKSFFYDNYRQHATLEIYQPDQWIQNLKIPVDYQDRIFFASRSLYIATQYLPQLPAMVLFTRILPGTLGVVHYSLRLSSLLVYALLIYLAIRLIPFGKWVMVVLALSPMCLLQATIISADGLNIGIAFLFLAWFLYLQQESIQQISTRQLVISLLMIGAIVNMKINLFPLLALLVIFPFKKLKSPKLIWLVAGFTFIAVLGGLAWNAAVSYLPGSFLSTGIADPFGQLKFILTHPFLYTGYLVSSLFMRSSDFTRQWIGVMGYGYWDLPVIVYYLYPLTLLGAILSEQTLAQLTIKKRLILLLIALLAIAASMTIFYMYGSSVGSPIITKGKGRHLIGLLPLFFLCLIPPKRLVRSWKFIPVLLAITLSVALVAEGLVYYHPCGDKYYESGLCQRPIYKNWAPDAGKSIEITQSTLITQTFISECDNFIGLKLWLYNPNQVKRGTTMVELVDPSTGNVIVHQDISNAGIQEPIYYTVNIPLIQHARIPYQFTVSSSALTPGDGLFIGLNQSPNEYRFGKATVNGDEIHNDILFQQVCRMGIADWLQSPP
jgi:uncharacterized membrane protein